MSKWEPQLKEKKVPLSTIKYISESGIGPESVGFTFKDFKALYGDRFYGMENGEQLLDKVRVAMEKPNTDLTEQEFELLDKIGVSAWDLIQSNSGGHKCITNISGLNYLGRAMRPSQDKYKYNSESEDAPYIKFVRMLQKEFVRLLQEKIEQSKTQD